MRIVLQRVKSAKVKVNEKIVSEIKKGLLLLVAIEKNDAEEDIKFLAEKVVNLRIFPDNEYRMNLSLIDVGGEILSISQFTLSSRIKKGRRPDFHRAMEPEKAKELYEKFLNALRNYNITVKDGVFGAMMDVELINWGPVTFILEDKKTLKNCS